MDTDLEVSNVYIVQERAKYIRFDACSPGVKEPRVLRRRADFVALWSMKDHFRKFRVRTR